jgi:hypothetical protein
MRIDSVSYNNRLIPKEDASYFKKFILMQDEVPPSLSRFNSDFAINLNMDSLFKYRIIQKKSSNIEICKKSIFTGHELQVAERQSNKAVTHGSDWMLSVMIFCAVMLAISKVLYSRRLNQILKAFISPRSVNQLSREGNISNESLSFMLSAVFFISLSVFIYENLFLFIPFVFNGNPNHLVFCYILFGSVIFYIIKKQFIKMVGYIFQTKQETKDYLLSTLVFNIVAGMYILPVSFLIYYLPFEWGYWLSVISFVILGIIIIYRVFRSFMIGISLTKFSVFYLFLYLCIIEILPILLILKIVRSYYC